MLDPTVVATAKSMRLRWAARKQITNSAALPNKGRRKTPVKKLLSLNCCTDAASPSTSASELNTRTIVVTDRTASEANNAVLSELLTFNSFVLLE